MYSSYTAASFARKHDLADRHGVNLEGALTWAFEFEDTPFFAGFRALATNGINLPVFNVFRMFSRMGAERIPATSDNADRPRRHRQAGRARAARCRRPGEPRCAAGDGPDLALPRRRRRRTGGGGLAGARGPGAEAGEGEAAALPDRRRPQQRVHRVEGHGLAGKAVARAVRAVGEGERAGDAARSRRASTWRTAARRSGSRCRGRACRCSCWSGDMLRWRIAILVSAAIAISYLDRQTLPVAIKAIGAGHPDHERAVLAAAVVVPHRLCGDVRRRRQADGRARHPGRAAR